MTRQALDAERAHLAGLLEAIQRCVYVLMPPGANNPGRWGREQLAKRRKDVDLFESLAAMNERFAKLQDTLGAAMRHAALLVGESSETFLKTLAFYEKVGVLESVATWQLCRATRNLGAHVYETDYAATAEHFDTLHTLISGLYANAPRFLRYTREVLGILPLHDDFAEESSAVAGDLDLLIQHP